MLLRIKAFVEYNIKSLIKDKLSFLWSIAVPTMVLLFSSNKALEPQDLRFWWSYIIISSYLFGVGIYALTLKESGVMRTIFSIKKDKISFFAGNLITQMIYSFICLFIFNLIASLSLDFNFLYLNLNSIKMIILCIPIAFLSYNFTLINRVHANTISTMANMVFFGLFILMGTDSKFNEFNPLIIIANTILITEGHSVLFFIIVSVMIILISIPSVLNYDCLSNERR